ncbi:MAG: tetratricopeptide repeat protein [archaeon]
MTVKKGTKMVAAKRQCNDPTRCSLKKLCELVKAGSYAYDDLAELIEDKGYEECVQGNSDEVINELTQLGVFFENVEEKNEEVARDLADVYLLTGEFCQCAEQYTDSIEWFRKAIAVEDVYDVPYHSLAMSYLSLGETEKAVKSLEQEIRVAPGNYYTYLFLADLYTKQEKYDEVEEVLRNLLARDSDNIQALHLLICHYKKRNPDLDVELLRRRLINADKELIKLDLIIWTYHVCEEKRFEEAIRYLTEREKEQPGISIIYLLKAHIYGLLQQFVKKRMELKQFMKMNHGREEFMRNKLDEFEKIFGKSARDQLQKKLSMTKMTSR